ncbi:hypothetical protein P154DRAFT_102986 [Amniculicola lignicola CBS 123094]|uniref:Uncharacterized protein n=1 Tax=Amniculicola lignicola CBS 123094 TaxID=1392246 RepID=A0A6A5WP39_9PLEO|nr:hypothetical protein P154DRAFT_102986 [Amniculicola lignicola CBS 123094]
MVEKIKQAQTPEMLESQPVTTEEIEGKDDTPFGIRAIESGIEIDGVWISRGNTPIGSTVGSTVGSTAGSSASSINEGRLGHSGNNSILEQPRATHASSSRTSSRPPSSGFDRAVSAERLPNHSRSSSPGREPTTNHRGRPPQARSALYHNANIDQNSTTLYALEGRSLPNPSINNSAQPSSSNSNKSNSSSSQNSDESDYMSLPDAPPYEPAYINPKHSSMAIPGHPSWDIDMLLNHRLSHVAETGQLTPRVRRPTTAADWANTPEHMRTSPGEISTLNGVEYFAPKKTPSPPLRPMIESPTEITPDLSGPPNSRYSHSSNQTRQAVHLSETYAPGAAYRPETYEPQGPQYSYEYLPYEVQTSQNLQRESQVLRKVNSGFEILRPGTFGEPSSVEDDKSADGDKRQSKRLQKKRRPSEASSTGKFIEQV